MGIIFALLIFSAIITIHEFGHFIIAKKNHIDVMEFAIGMGPKLIGKEYKGTLYSIRLLPIGGFCAMGEDDTDVENLTENSFNNKSVWARMAVIFAGPAANFILAFLLSVILVGWLGYDQPVAGGIVENSPAWEAGLQEGDRIVKMDNKTIHIFREITVYNQMNAGKEVKVTYERDGKRDTVAIQPQKSEDGSYLFGISGNGNTKANPLTALQYGLYEVKYWISTTIDSLKMLFTGAVGVDQLSGPVGIVNLVDDSYDANKVYGIGAVVSTFMNIAILISANLGVMNLLPIPALDGGRLLFLIVEAIRGKKWSQEKESMINFAGFALLMALMVFVMFNDIKRILF
ncbi:RIP metalloprotease RseP [Lachnoclostridium sp. An181]|uniref:RIP metalloprotease RseP n=1 Tax=Lachnoclostridium sp. An181 TaxID=1965575 RepID=UPI000B3917D2|nr:RIP metalloprotease RseP [Lachnoclostridium sp. An181]OUP50045.1 RIP metalloprotease RseP [Lachnoclostridium sp. An181]